VDGYIRILRSVKSSVAKKFTTVASPDVLGKTTLPEDRTVFSLVAGNAMTLTSWKSSAGFFNVKLTFCPPDTWQLTEVRYLIACSGFTQGPPDWLHPGELKIPISIPNSVAVFKAICNTFHHSSLPNATLG
jgi:hypothetical protein